MVGVIEFDPGHHSAPLPRKGNMELLDIESQADHKSHWKRKTEMP